MTTTGDAESLRRAWSERGWPAELFERALALRMPLRAMEAWLARGDGELERAQGWIPQLEELTFGSIRGREVTFLDNDRFAELWANAPEDVGDWEITVERAPNAFAQFQLQENVSIPVLEQNGVLLACVVWSHLNTVVGGRRICVHCGQGLRVRRDCRGKGYGNLVRAVAKPVWAPYTSGQFHYIRSQNYAAVDFFRHTSPIVVASSPEREGDVPGYPVTVLQYPRRPFSGDATGIRRAERSDLRRCVALINRTHRGLDLFRPYTVESLELKLDERCWSRPPPGSPQSHVYGWEDFCVVEDEGRVVACAGLWDRGRDMRERWRNTSTGEERSMDVTALLDVGVAAGHERSLARLIGCFIGETDRLGRGYLLAPLQRLPRVAAELEELEPVPETRGLGWLVWDETFAEPPPDSLGLEGAPFVVAEPRITRPYTDLAYW